MRCTVLTISILAATLVVTLPNTGAAQTPDTCRLPMGPYYASLLASARGDADGTLRHLLVLQSRWEQVTRSPLSAGCSWLNDVVDGRSPAAAIASALKAARERLPRDVPAAHAELETIRGVLRNARAAHGLRSFDDALTDYHDAIERLTNLMGERNEVALTRSDFDAIGERARLARNAWADVERHHSELTTAAAWTALAGETGTALAETADRAASQDATGVHTAGERVKARYFDLLRLVSRAG